ncbi:hypothetical protein, partial [Neisseria sicca]
MIREFRYTRVCAVRTHAVFLNYSFSNHTKGRLKPIFRRPFAPLPNKNSHHPLPKRRPNQ